MRRILCALAALTLLVAGCSSDEPQVTVASPSATPEPTESPTPPPPPPVAVLTGQELDAPIDRPVLAIKIDNAPLALPPDGIENADIVFEEEVEGGITRFLALYQSDDPEEVGPVRSGREADVELLVPFRPVLGLSGAARVVQDMFREAGIPFFEEGEADDAFYRVDDRVAPHNLFATTEKLWAEGEDLEPLEDPVFDFGEEIPGGGRDVESVEVVFSPYVDATWTWADGQWEREQNGEPHETAAGDAVRADNVVVMRVQARQGNRRDSGGNPTLELDIVGKGKATYFRDGQEFKGRWSKDSREDQLVWMTRDGDEFPLKPGQTFIEILPVQDSMSTTKAAGGGSADQ